MIIYNLHYQEHSFYLLNIFFLLFFYSGSRLLIIIVKWDIYKEIVRGPCGFTVIDSFLDGQTYSEVFLKPSRFIHLSLPFCTHLPQPPLYLFIYSFSNLPCLSPYSYVFFNFIHIHEYGLFYTYIYDSSTAI